MRLPPSISAKEGVVFPSSLISEAISLYAFEDNKMLLGGITFKKRVVIKDGFAIQLNLKRNTISDFTTCNVLIDYAPLVEEEDNVGEYFTVDTDFTNSLGSSVESVIYDSSQINTDIFSQTLLYSTIASSQENTSKDHVSCNSYTYTEKDKLVVFTGFQSHVNKTRGETYPNITQYIYYSTFKFRVTSTIHILDVRVYNEILYALVGEYGKWNLPLGSDPKRVKLYTIPVFLAGSSGDYFDLDTLTPVFEGILSETQFIITPGTTYNLIGNNLDPRLIEAKLSPNCTQVSILIQTIDGNTQPLEITALDITIPLITVSYIGLNLTTFVTSGTSSSFTYEKETVYLKEAESGSVGNVTTTYTFHGSVKVGYQYEDNYESNIRKWVTFKAESSGDFKHTKSPFSSSFISTGEIKAGLWIDGIYMCPGIGSTFLKGCDGYSSSWTETSNTYSAGTFQLSNLAIFNKDTVVYCDPLNRTGLLLSNTIESTISGTSSTERKYADTLYILEGLPTKIKRSIEVSSKNVSLPNTGSVEFTGSPLPDTFHSLISQFDEIAYTTSAFIYSITDSIYILSSHTLAGGIIGSSDLAKNINLFWLSEKNNSTFLDAKDILEVPTSSGIQDLSDTNQKAIGGLSFI